MYTLCMCVIKDFIGFAGFCKVCVWTHTPQGCSKVGPRSEEWPGSPEIRNPKPRNPKEIRNPKAEIRGKSEGRNPKAEFAKLSGIGFEPKCPDRDRSPVAAPRNAGLG